MSEQKPATLEELRDLIEDAIELGEENNKLLKAMRRDALIGSILKTLLWVALIGLSLYFSAKFIEPYLGMLQAGGQGSENADIGSLIEEYKSLLGQ